MTMLCPILVTAPLNVDTNRGGLSGNRNEDKRIVFWIMLRFMVGEVAK